MMLDVVLMGGFVHISYDDMMVLLRVTFLDRGYVESRDGPDIRQCRISGYKPGIRADIKFISNFDGKTDDEKHF